MSVLESRGPAGSPAPRASQVSDTVSSHQPAPAQLAADRGRVAEPRRDQRQCPAEPSPDRVTHRTVSKSNGDRFKPLTFEVICYATVGNDTAIRRMDVGLILREPSPLFFL